MSDSLRTDRWLFGSTTLMALVLGVLSVTVSLMFLCFWYSSLRAVLESPFYDEFHPGKSSAAGESCAAEVEQLAGVLERIKFERNLDSWEYIRPHEIEALGLDLDCPQGGKYSWDGTKVYCSRHFPDGNNFNLASSRDFWYVRHFQGLEKAEGKARMNLLAAVCLSALGLAASFWLWIVGRRVSSES